MLRTWLAISRCSLLTARQLWQRHDEGITTTTSLRYDSETLERLLRVGDIDRAERDYRSFLQECPTKHNILSLAPQDSSVHI